MIFFIFVTCLYDNELNWKVGCYFILKYSLLRVLQNQMIRDTYTPEATEALKRIKYVTLLAYSCICFKSMTMTKSAVVFGQHRPVMNSNCYWIIHYVVTPCC